MHHAAQSGLNFGLDRTIKRACCLVQNHDRGVLQDHAGQGQTLTLPPRQFHAAFADMGVIAAPPFAVLQPKDKVMRVSLFGCVFYLGLRNRRLPQPDVVAHGPVQ